MDPANRHGVSTLTIGGGRSTIRGGGDAEMMVVHVHDESDVRHGRSDRRGAGGALPSGSKPGRALGKGPPMGLHG